MELLSEQEQVNRDLDLWQAEEDWKASLPKHSDVGWLQIFPEAKKVFGKFIRLRLNVRSARLKIEYSLVEEETKRRLESNPPESKWRDDLIIDAGRRKLAAIKKELNAIHHQLLLLKDIGKKPEEIKARDKKIVITEAMVEKAKEYPLNKLIEINRQGFTKCFGHNDKRPSAYCKKNFINCFVCQKSWDTIQVLIDRDGMTFRQAVLQLQ